MCKRVKYIADALGDFCNFPPNIPKPQNIDIFLVPGTGTDSVNRKEGIYEKSPFK